MNTILRGLIDLLSDAVDVADPRLPAELSGAGVPMRNGRRRSRARRIGALLFLAALALLPLLAMALMTG